MRVSRSRLGMGRWVVVPVREWDVTRGPVGVTGLTQTSPVVQPCNLIGAMHSEDQ